MKRLFNLMLVATIGATSIATVNAKPMPSNAVPTTAKIQYNNEPVREANGFIIDGYTYLRLRDMAEIMDFGLTYDNQRRETNMIETATRTDRDTIGMGRIDHMIQDNVGYLYNSEQYYSVRFMDAKLGFDSIDYDNNTKVITLVELDNMHTPTSDISKPNNNNNNSNSNATTNGSTQTVSDEITKQDIQDYNEELLRLVNEARVEAGVKPLTLSDELVNLATMKADEMVELNYFDHKSPNYGMPWEMYKKVYGTSGAVGENITKSKGKTLSQYIEKGYDLTYYANVTAKSNFNSWWNSQGHKDNMLNPKYTQMGSSFSVDKDGTCVAVQMFIY